jgi:hypothetical protein
MFGEEYDLTIAPHDDDDDDDDDDDKPFITV